MNGEEAVKVLIVDDDPMILQLTAKGLRKRGYQVETQSDANRAISHAREFGPDIIILDIDMPGLSGGMVAEQIKMDPVLESTPFVFMSSLITPQDEKAEKAPYGYIAKPASIQGIEQMIQKYIA